LVEFRFGNRQRCALYLQLSHASVLCHILSVVSARERRWFWASLPSKTFLSALAADAVAATALTFVGLPGLMPLRWWQTVVLDPVAREPVDVPAPWRG
jgi:hypothetical protein